MSSYSLIVFLHIASAVLLLGTSILGEPAVRAAARRAAHPQDLRAILEFGRPMAVISPIAALLLLASGAYLTSIAGLWRLGWIQVAVVFWLVNSVVALAAVKPAINRVAGEAAGALEIGPRLERLRWSASWTWGVDTMAANDAAMLYLMTLKPGLAGSVAVVLIANALVLAARFALVRRPGFATARGTPGT